MTAPTDSVGTFASFHATLRDGRSVIVRTISSDDAGGVQAAFGRVSEEARYTRFMAPLKELSPAMLDQAVSPLAERFLALVAVAGDPKNESIVGGARYLGAADGTCEFAILIADDWQGMGLASQLMKALIRDARARGLSRMHGYVLAGNRPMLDLARRLGFEVGPSEEGPRVKLVQLALADAAARGI